MEEESLFIIPSNGRRAVGGGMQKFPPISRLIKIQIEVFNMETGIPWRVEKQWQVAVISHQHRAEHALAIAGNHQAAIARARREAGRIIPFGISRPRIDLWGNFRSSGNKKG